MLFPPRTETIESASDLERGSATIRTTPDISRTQTLVDGHVQGPDRNLRFADDLGRDVATYKLPRPEQSPSTSGHVPNGSSADASQKYDEKIQKIIVDFDAEDPRNPFNYSPRKKWLTAAVPIVFAGFATAGGGTFPLGSQSMRQDLNCTELQASAGLSLYALGFALAPLFLASFSEEFGRRVVYLVSAFVFWLSFLPVALAENIAVVLVFRFIGGMAASTGSTMVGGTLADMYHTYERGLPMTIFGLSTILGTGIGPVIAGWIDQSDKLEWRWIQWVNFISSGVFFVIVVLFLKETRGPALLAREAARLRKETGDDRYQTISNTPPLRELIWIAMTRPLHLLFTEPVVLAFSLWAGFAWGVLFGLMDSIGLVFRELYNFGPGGVGSVFTGVCVGSLLGLITSLYQERLYSKYEDYRGPEARLYSACAAGLLLPAGCFTYAWTLQAHVHWIAPIAGITLIIWAILIIYIAVFNYLADCYLKYASSALAGQSLCRNLAGFAFPLFAKSMYRGLGFNWAGSLLGFVAIGLSTIPIVLFIWGPQIRARSKFAKQMASLQRTESHM